MLPSQPRRNEAKDIQEILLDFYCHLHEMILLFTQPPKRAAKGGFRWYFSLLVTIERRIGKPEGTGNSWGENNNNCIFLENITEKKYIFTKLTENQNVKNLIKERKTTQLGETRCVFWGTTSFSEPVILIQPSLFF